MASLLAAPAYSPPCPEQAEPAWPPPPQISAAHVETALSLVRIPWLHDFLLAPPASTDADTLLNPAGRAHAWAADVHVSLSASGGSLALSGTLALVPALAVGTLTVGTATGATLSGELRAGRFARDDATGALLLIAFSGDMVEVAHFGHESAARSARLYLRCDAARFSSALASPSFSAADVAATVVCGVHLRELRACPMCRSEPTAPCACRLAFIPPASSTDFGPLRANMAATMGVFAGAGAAGPGSGQAHAEATVRVAVPADNAAPLRIVEAVAARLGGPSAPPRAFPESIVSAQADEPRTDGHFVRGQFVPDLQLPADAYPSANGGLLSGALGQVSPVSGAASPASASGCTGGGTEEEALLPDSPVSPEAGPAPPTRARRAPRRPMTEQELKAREERRQVRIMKNRAAAARSNARRKKHNDALKGALAEARGRALELRDRHMELREENLRLKTLLLL